MNNIKISHIYKFIKGILDENIKKLIFKDDHKKIIYSLLKSLSIEFLEKNFSNKFSDSKNKGQFDTNIDNYY